MDKYTKVSSSIVLVLEIRHPPCITPPAPIFLLNLTKIQKLVETLALYERSLYFLFSINRHRTTCINPEMGEIITGQSTPFTF